jgi:hypothetical protein
MPDQLLEIEAGHSLQHDRAPSPHAGDLRVEIPVDRRARADLRRQIAGLEQQLAELFVSAFPRRGIEWRVGAVGGPKVLDVSDLERVRDALALRVSQARAEVSRRGEVEEANRGLVESMIARPDEYRWVQVSAEDVGERDCRHWHSRPRWGILGMLMGWWRVKHSSGCPLAEGWRPLQTADELQATS